jgi:hypothetical protein
MQAAPWEKSAKISGNLALIFADFSSGHTIFQN